MRSSRKPAPASCWAVLWASPSVGVPFSTATVTDAGRTGPAVLRRCVASGADAEVLAEELLLELLERARTTPTATAARMTAVTTAARITRPRSEEHTSELQSR